MFSTLQKYKEEDALLYITYVVQKVGRKTIWAKILQINEEENNILLYDVDQKSVEQLKINQIDEIEKPDAN
ncbi:hypothetical protein [Tuberibacillus calidus]|jgi:hypothetical protein|uniref:hypothetical protein n=1 Tax=Tuberibacillus calidus TaxID=340097 RepID=UPI000413777B|nr:hypothetical protein [Tuberibacillus calidus]